MEDVESIQPYPASKPQRRHRTTRLCRRVYPTLSCKQAATCRRRGDIQPESLSNPILQASRNAAASGSVDERESIQPYPASKPQLRRPAIRSSGGVYPTLSCKQAATRVGQWTSCCASLSNPILQASRNTSEMQAAILGESIQPYPASKPQHRVVRIEQAGRVYPTLSCKQAATPETYSQRHEWSLSNPILQASRNRAMPTRRVCCESIQPYPASKPQQRTLVAAYAF